MKKLNVSVNKQFTQGQLKSRSLDLSLDLYEFNSDAFYLTIGRSPIGTS